MVIGLVILSTHGGDDASWHQRCHTNLEEKMGEQSQIVPCVTAKGSYSQSAILIL